MTSFLRKSGHIIARGVLSLCALLFIALISVQILLVVGINLLSTGRGSDFLSGKINTAIESSGYHIGFDALYYDPVRGFTVYDLSVSDREGEFLSLDRFSLALSFALSPLRTLELSANGGTLFLSRLPAAQEKPETEEKDPLRPFETPDIYFRTIRLSGLSFEHIVLGEDVAGKPYSFSPSLQGRVTLNDVIGVSLGLQPGLSEIAPHLPAPGDIAFSGSFDPATLVLTLDKLSVSASDYDLTAQGKTGLSEDGMIDLAAQARHADLSSLTQDALKEAAATLVVKGPLRGPAIDLSAAIVTGGLKDKGLSDILVSLKTENIAQGMAGDARVETAFRDKPVVLQSALSYEAPVLRVTGLQGSAPALELSGEGTLSTDTMLFDGALQVAADDLAIYSELAGIALAGKLDAKAVFKPSSEGGQSGELSATVTKGVFENVKVGRLSAQASLQSLSTPWPYSAKADISALQLSDTVTLDKVKAAVTDAGAQNYKLSLEGAGRVPAPLSFNGSAVLSDLAQSVPSARDIALTVTQGASAVKLSGAFAKEAVDLVLTADGYRGADLPVSLPAGLEDVRIDVKAAMTGAPSRPQTDLTADVRNIGAGDYKNASLSFKAKHDGEKVSADLSGRGTGIRKLESSASFPMTLSLLPFAFTLEQDSALSGILGADLDLAALSPLFLPPTQSLSGDLVANGTIAGTIADPAPSATLRLNKSRFEDNENGILVDDLAAAANITRESVTLTSLSATDGKNGTISGKGSLSFGGGATDIGLRMRDFNVPQSNLANGIIGADLSLKGSPDGMSLTGKADIGEMNVLIPETFSSRIPQLNIVENEKKGPGFLDRLTLDIGIDAHNQVFVRGWGLDAEFGGNVAITGNAASPQFNGTLASRRGRFEEFGKRFKLERANLRFQGEIPPSPYLDIEATTPAGDVTGSVLFTGPVASPSIAFSSTPALPEDEVLSRILFGKDSAKISPFQAVQLAQTIQRFSGKGGGAGLDPLAMIRSATGLDDISVETDESGQTNVDVGKYLTDNVYLELSKGKAENSGEATIQIEVTPSINIESNIGQDAQGGGGVFWKKDY